MYQEPDELEEPHTPTDASEEMLPEDIAQEESKDETVLQSAASEVAEASEETSPEGSPEGLPGEVAVSEETPPEGIPEPLSGEVTAPEETSPEGIPEPLSGEVAASEETSPEGIPEPLTGEMAASEPGLSESGEPSPDQPAWYVVHCYSGYENKVRHNLEQRIETMGMKDKIFDVVIPTQEEIEVREGKRRTVERHIFPGYVLVNMILTEESWYVVRNTPGVTGFVGMGTNPTPLRPEEVNQIIKRMEAEAPRVKVSFKEGERVRIIDGPFNDFRGTVAEIDMERTKVRVMVSMFGRDTPVELDFLQVERA